MYNQSICYQLPLLQCPYCCFIDMTDVMWGDSFTHLSVYSIWYQFYTMWNLTFLWSTIFAEIHLTFAWSCADAFFNIYNTTVGDFSNIGFIIVLIIYSHYSWCKNSMKYDKSETFRHYSSQHTTVFISRR